MKNTNDSKSGFVVVNAPAGFHTDLWTNVSDIPGSFPTGTGEYLYFVQITGNKGKWFSTEEESIQGLKKSISKEIARVEKRGDLRPSEVRRLDLLRSMV